jgi:hypothetical protein
MVVDRVVAGKALLRNEVARDSVVLFADHK